MQHVQVHPNTFHQDSTAAQLLPKRPCAFSLEAYNISVVVLPNYDQVYGRTILDTPIGFLRDSQLGLKLSNFWPVISVTSQPSISSKVLDVG